MTACNQSENEEVGGGGEGSRGVTSFDSSCYFIKFHCDEICPDLALKVNSLCFYSPVIEMESIIEIPIGEFLCYDFNRHFWNKGTLDSVLFAFSFWCFFA